MSENLLYCGPQTPELLIKGCPKYHVRHGTRDIYDGYETTYTAYLENRESI
jgi:hypothetical protein